MKTCILALMAGITLTFQAPATAIQPPDQIRRESERPTRPQGSGDAGGRRSQNPLVLALDADGDGSLSAREIAGATAALKRLDKNGDGRLSREELRPETAREGGPDQRGGGTPGQRSRPPSPPAALPRAGEGSSNAPNQRPANPASAGSRPAFSSRARAVPGPLPGFVVIPGGEFDMGDHHDLGGQEHSNDELPIHRVRIDSFSMAVHETTNQQYCAYLNAALAERSIVVKEGLVYSADGKFLYCDTHASDQASSIELTGGKFTIVDGRANHPAVCIRWHGAAACSNWLSRKQGYQPLYDPATWQCDFTRPGFRLPTEAEWEYAGRGGLDGPYTIFPWGDDPDFTKANWPNSGDPYEAGDYPLTTPVGFYDGKPHRKADFGWPGPQETYQTSDSANGYGLYDMAGNAWEWVGDWYDHNYYEVSPAENPHGPDRGQPMRDDQPYRVLRGGSCYNGQWGHSRVSNRNPSYYRGPDDPNHRWYHIGFRIVLKTANAH